MYVPAMFDESRPEVLHRFVRAQPLGMLLTHTAEGLGAELLPFLLDDTQRRGRLPDAALRQTIARYFDAVADS